MADYYNVRLRPVEWIEGALGKSNKGKHWVKHVALPAVMHEVGFGKIRAFWLGAHVQPVGGSKWLSLREGQYLALQELFNNMVASLRVSGNELKDLTLTFFDVYDVKGVYKEDWWSDITQLLDTARECWVICEYSLEFEGKLPNELLKEVKESLQAVLEKFSGESDE